MFWWKFDKIIATINCDFRNYKRGFLQILHDSSVSWKISPPYFFSSKIVYFAWKGLIKVQILETFECLDQNSLNSCKFWNNKLVFLQIWINLQYHETTLLYFFWLKLDILSTKGTYQSTNLMKFTWAVKIFLKFCTLIGSFCKYHEKF